MLWTICGVAFATSLLTFFSGFGLGTLLLPAFTAFFPLDLAIAMTAIVHFSNNLFKLVLVGRYTDWNIVKRFGIPAIIAAFVGAGLLLWLANLPNLAEYEMMGRTFQISLVKLVIAALMVLFAAFEAIPKLSKASFDEKYLPAGGLLSGFFGGLSGHQGAFRSAFLARSGLNHESFVATGVVIACLVDVTRLAVYMKKMVAIDFIQNGVVLLSAIGGAFIGAWLGSRLLQKITIRTIQIIIAFLLVVFAIGLGLGVI
jgi:uncharacterized membrane protein YfcA